MNKDYFKTEIGNIFKEYKNGMYYMHADFISEKINEGLDIVELPVNQIQSGNFYFLFYGLNNKKISKMEKFNPVLVIDFHDIENTRILFGVSINFMPITVRTIFFNNLLNFFLKTIEENKDKDTFNQQPLQGLTFGKMYNLLETIGFEWAMRKLDMRFIDRVYKINTNILPQFITMSTAKFTGVDDLKLIDIWKTKIKKQDERKKKIMLELLNNFKEMQTQLNNRYITLRDRNDSLEESMNIIKNNF